MIVNTLRWFDKGAYFLISLFLLFGACRQPEEQPVPQAVFLEIEKLYLNDLNACKAALEQLEKVAASADTGSFEQLQVHYLLARRHFKFAEPVLAFSEQENYRFLNQPNILKVEEEDYTDIKIKEPSGFQVLEELIFAEKPDKVAIGQHAGLMINRLQLICKNTNLQHYQDYHFLWMLRNALVRIALTGLTGFDSPVLENSLEESLLVYQRLQRYLAMFRPYFSKDKLYLSWQQELERAMATLQGDFSSFDRYGFIKNHTHRQLALWVQTKDDWKVRFPFTMALNHEANSLFGANTFNQAHFDALQKGDLLPERVLLGKKLFHDRRLSANGKMSCASCHQEALAFSDGLPKSPGQTRNSPTLMYASLQRGLFYDKRSGSLEGQIVSVVNNEKEFHSNLKAMEAVVGQQTAYLQQFEQLYDDGVTEANIRNAIASYIKNLAPFNSRFDRSISGREEALSAEEIRGFNLFMGKAKCATCHFAPVFNGTVPPEFTETEMELLGVPATTDTLQARIDPDLGRFNLYGTEQRKFFFKTPSLRNIALTAPYMHNGVYSSLEEVMDFYNRGGGAGLGIALEYQTLPADKLNLSKQEINALIAFMKSLTDESLNSEAEKSQETAKLEHQ